MGLSVLLIVLTHLGLNRNNKIIAIDINRKKTSRILVKVEASLNLESL
jgi:hypothetical protein